MADKIRIGVMAPGSRIAPEIAARVSALAVAGFANVELAFHPQCFLSDGHFSGNDDTRARAFLEIANDPAFDALWFARGGYGAARIAETVLSRLEPAAKTKTYLGYSDNGFLLAGLYRDGHRAVHAPVPYDIKRDGGNAAVARTLGFLTGDKAGLEPSQPAVAFNLTVLSMLVGTKLMPDLGGHVVMIEEVSEHLYAVDRLLYHVTASGALRGAAGIRLGRIGDVPPNNPAFGQTPEEIVRHWCKVSGIPYRGVADIGHDSENKIVPFGARP